VSDATHRVADLELVRDLRDRETGPTLR